MKTSSGRSWRTWASVYSGLAPPLRPPCSGRQPPPQALCVSSSRTGCSESAFPDRSLRSAGLGENVHRTEKTPAGQALPKLRLYAAVLRLRTPVLLVVRLTSQGSDSPHISMLNTTAVEETTQPTTGTIRNGKRLRRRFLSGHLPNAGRWVVHPALLTPHRQNGQSHPPSWKVWDLTGTTSVEAVSSRQQVCRFLTTLPA